MIPGQEPDPPVFPPGGSLLDTIDFQVAIPPYTLQYNTDEYRWFVIENPFPTTVYVNAIEVFAGLDSVVHHADISYDNTGQSLANDLLDPLPGFNGNTGTPTYSYLHERLAAGRQRGALSAAMGHRCSAERGLRAGDPLRARRIRARWIPR